MILFEMRKVDFHDCVFDNDVDFKINHDRGSQPMFGNGASLRNVLFLKPERTTFRHVDLSMVEFLGTDLGRINFVSVYWPEFKRFKFAWSGNLRELKLSGVYDEILLATKENLNKDEIELLRTEYRRLKQNYDENKNYPMADQFYVGEMEVTRHYDTPLFWKLFSWRSQYRFASGYGTLPGRSLAILFLVLILFSLEYMFTGLKVNSSLSGKALYINYDLAWCLPNLNMALTDWLYCVWFGISSILPFKDSAQVFEPSMWTRVIQLIETIILPVVVALFAFALRRRFKR